MNLLRSLLFLAVLSSIVSRKIATAQDDFGAVLLEAFTTGMFDGESTSEELEPSPAVAPTAFLDDGLLGFPLESVDPEASPMESPEETVDYFFDLDESLLASPEESPVESVEGIDNGFSPFEGETTAVPRPIQVNCGSFDSRNTFSTDVAEWFSLDSIAAVDPFADAQFESNEHALLYSTFRYSPTNLTYTVPVPTNGFWSVTLHWAEITPKYMSIGARIFSVTINGREYEKEVDVYEDSPLRSFSPLLRSYVAEAIEGVLKVELGRKVGEPMLSAFQITYNGPIAQ